MQVWTMYTYGHMEYCLAGIGTIRGQGIRIVVDEQA